MITLTSYLGRVFLILILMSAVSMGSTTAQPGGRLIVLRAPNFGWNLVVNLKIDGRTVANVVQGRSYDHFIPAGRHVLTVSAAPSASSYQPTSTSLNVHPGESYVFMAMWHGTYQVFLRPTELTPTQMAQLRSY
jgi:hypothetical protein